MTTTSVTYVCGSGDLYGNDAAFLNTAGQIGFGGGGAGETAYKAWVPFTVNLRNRLKIFSATLKVRAASNKGGTTVKVKIGCEAADNPSAPANWSQLNARTLTTAYTTDDNVSAWTEGTEYSFDITTAVQEILNRAGWASGQTMAVLTADNGSTTGATREFASSENASYDEAKLVIAYYKGGQVI